MNMQRCPFTRMAAALLFAVSLSLGSCENDLKDVEKISARKLSVPVDRSTGVEVIYSDSAVVKAKLITPELLNYKTEKPYMEMKKGITVIFYDANQEQVSKITADYAIRREHEKLVELKRNVVAVNNKGETFKSEELFWDEAKKRFYSNRLVTVSSAAGVLYGTGFWANEDFSLYEMASASGNMDVGDKVPL